MENYKQIVVEIISKMSGVEVGSLTEETAVGSLGINSISFIQIMVEIEQALNIDIDDEDLDISNLVVLGDLFNVLEKTMANKTN